MPCFRFSCLTIFTFCFSVLPALASDCTAPVLHYQLKGSYPGGWFGVSVAGVGDLNGDGTPDFMVAAPITRVGTISQAGSVYAYSGLDGSLLYQLNGTTVAEKFGGSFSGPNRTIAGIGDIDRDGRSDFIVGAPDANYAAVFSGADGDSLFKIRGDSTTNSLGYSVSGIGDINEDTVPDFIIGSIGKVFLYSGIDGSLLFQNNRPPSGGVFGHSVAGTEDVNGDGKPDLIIGDSWFYNPIVGAGGGAAFVYSVPDSMPIHQKYGQNDHDHLGWAVANAGDLDGDSIADFISSAPSQFNFYDEDLGPSFVYVYSGATGNLIFEKTGGSVDAFGLSIDGNGDVNGDGKPDFIVGAPGEASLRLFMFPEKSGAYVYSGIEGGLIFQIINYYQGSNPENHLGYSVSFVGDLNNDGKADVLLGAPGSLIAGSQDSGSAFVYVSKTVPKGDLNFDSTLTIADVTNLLNVVFIDNSSAISPCTADLNCDGTFSPGDIVLLLNRVFLQTALPCS